MLLRRLGLALLPLLVAGCAKFPDESNLQNDTRISFSFTVAGELRGASASGPGYVYIVALRTDQESNPTSVGPQPVVTYPNANGFVAGEATHYIRWDPSQAVAYLIYRFIEPTDGDPAKRLTAWREVGIPIIRADVPSGGRTLQFEISTRQLADVVADADKLQSIQVNFLTMNRVSTESGANRIIDALGDTQSPSGINQNVRIPLTTSGRYDDTRFNDLEPEGDTPDPDLDIIDWSIEVRRQ